MLQSARLTTNQGWRAQSALLFNLELKKEEMAPQEYLSENECNSLGRYLNSARQSHFDFTQIWLTIFILGNQTQK